MDLRGRLVASLASTVLLASLIAACSDSTDRDLSPDPASNEPTAGAGTSGPAVTGPNPPGIIPLADAPGTTATANGRTVEMGIGTHCWGQMCVDMIGPVTKDSLDATRGDIVEVALPEGTSPLRELSAVAFPATTFTTLDSGAKAWSAGAGGATLAPGGMGPG